MVITLPLRTAEAAGRALLMDHAGWIAERLARLPQAVLLGDGTEIPLGGEMVVVRHIAAGRGTRLVGAELLVSGSIEFLSRRVTDFLRVEARRRLGALAVIKASDAGLRVQRVIVKDTRSRWGSCTAGGTLMFSWRLVMAPAEVQDYVVAHEVAHLRHMNHGPGFWALVQALTPHRQAATLWLARGGAGLMRIG